MRRRTLFDSNNKRQRVNAMRTHASIVSLPYTFNPLMYPDGFLPDPWTGLTFRINGDHVENTPSMGANLLTDPGLEAAYAAGLCGTLTKNGNPTLADAAPDVHGGAHAQGFTATAQSDYVKFPVVAGIVGGIYHLSGYCKRVSGANRNAVVMAFQTGALPVAAPAGEIVEADYTDVLINLISTTTNDMTLYALRDGGVAGFCHVEGDDYQLTLLSDTSLHALLPTGLADITIKMRLDTLVDNSFIGIAFRASSSTNPANCCYVLVRQYNGFPTDYLISIVKKIGTTYSLVLAEQDVTIVPDADLEVRLSGSTVKLYYNGAQVSGDQTISDIQLRTNTYHGIWSAGGNRVKRFFASSQLTDMSVGWAGSSNTYNLSGYRIATQESLMDDLPEYDFLFYNTAANGWATFPNLVNLADLASADVILFDQSNDGTDDIADVEALLRNTYGSGQRLIGIINPVFSPTTDDQLMTPGNKDAMIAHAALLNAYHVPYVDGWQVMIDYVNHGGHIIDLMPDGIHWGTAGTEKIRSLLMHQLPDGGSFILAARQYADSADLQNAPVIKNGTGYDSKTGTWTTTGTRIDSSDVGATVTYSGTFRKFGIWRADTANYPSATVEIDGGAPFTLTVYPNGYDIGARAAHTIVITVTSALRIDEFWAI